MPAPASGRDKSSAGARHLASNRTRAVIFLLINVIVWGAALPISKYAVENTSPFFFLFYRFLFSGLITIPLLAWYLRHLSPKRQHIKQIIGIELLGTTVALGLLYLGLSYTTSLEASLIVMTEPLFVTIGGILFLREREERREWAGLLLALTGTSLITLDPVLRGGAALTNFSFIGNALIFAQNIVTMAYFLLAKRFYRNIPKFFVTSLSFWIGMVTFGMLALWQAGGIEAFVTIMIYDLMNPFVLLPSLYMAVFGSIIGLTTYILGQNLIEASEASVFTYLQPFISIPLALWLHRESPSWIVGLALLVIVVGVCLVQMRVSPSRRRNQKGATLRRSLSGR